MKRITILNAGILVVLTLSLLYFTSCAKKSLVKTKPVKKGRVGEEFIIQRSSEKVPDWVNDPEFQVVKEKKEKFIVVKADISDYKEQRAAERIAEGELRKKVAEGIKTLVDSQFREAMAGTSETFSESFESYVEVVANDIPVIGLVVTDTYWEKIQKIKAENEVEYVYRVLKRARMPYENYVNARDNAWNEVLTKAKTDEEKEELNKLITNMKGRDEE